MKDTKGKINIEVNFEVLRNGKIFSKEYSLNDESHLKNFINKIMQNKPLQKTRYVNHRILYRNDIKVFSLDEASYIFQKSKDYSSFEDLIKAEFKINI